MDDDSAENFVNTNYSPDSAKIFELLLFAVGLLALAFWACMEFFPFFFYPNQQIKSSRQSSNRWKLLFFDRIRIWLNFINRQCHCNRDWWYITFWMLLLEFRCVGNEILFLNIWNMVDDSTGWRFFVNILNISMQLH